MHNSFNYTVQAENIVKESPVWSVYHEEKLKAAKEGLLLNGFDHMIKLTNEGKLWKFPIDNEQGFFFITFQIKKNNFLFCLLFFIFITLQLNKDSDEKEANIPFHEHVFLDQYLEDFPNIAAIQEFMTLVLNGLSLNSFLTLNEKKEIIDWYKEYFKEKDEIIKKIFETENRAKAEGVNQSKKKLFKTKQLLIYSTIFKFRFKKSI